ncbi:MAG TPA: hypothetical protein VFN35_20110 [Ktedonobacteraceae bacterium]|nr:hypothetical protein [Ktedonobacteraceae bacterium]
MSDELGKPLDELGEPLQVEIFAASLRADTNDLRAYLEVLATKLSGALPHQTTVTRQNKLFSREHPVQEISVTLGDYQYRISQGQRGILLLARARVVRGIVLKTDQLSMEQWITELAMGLSLEASQSAQARIALERFLL